MKVMFISDIHGDLACLQKALDRFEKEGADSLAVLGDVLYHGPRNPIPEGYDPKGTADLLNRFKDRILAVRGNCDGEVDQMLIKYPMMSDYAMILEGGRRFFLTHGHVQTAEKAGLSPGDVYVFGHVHYPVCEKNMDGVYIFNPGSISLPKRSQEKSYGIYESGVMYVKNMAGMVILSCELS